jgi:uncharacterized protein (DUF1015 family)
MAEIAAFRAIHFDPSNVRLEDVIAPPYDVLSAADQGALYARSPHNIVRLILNREEPQDGPLDRYARAAEFLRSEMANGAMVEEERPALYEYIQAFPHPLDPAQTVSRTALFVALRLQSYSDGVVLPHEETHSKAKVDRLHLMRATGANPEPIYGLYEDAGQAVVAALGRARAGMAPLLHAAVPFGPGIEQHTLYRHDDPTLLQEVTELFRQRRIWIADGHHRYETALNYQAEMRESVSGRAGAEASAAGAGAHPWEYILIGLSAFEDPGIVVLPTHRLIKGLAAARMEDLALQLERFFHLQVLTVEAALDWVREEMPGETRIGLVLPDRAYALTLRDEALADAAMGEGHCEAWRRLAVSILQALVLDRTLGISQADLAHTPDVAYTRDVNEAVERVRSGEFQLSCLLPMPTVDEVRAVAAAGDKMPQKSTYFYPKLWSGLVIRRICDP